MRLLLDTHVWLWYVGGSDSLPRALRSAVDDAFGSCWLSPITLWEAEMLVRKQRIRVQGEPAAWIEQCLEGYPMREAPVNFEVARRVGGLGLPHRDPADAFLVASAQVFDLTLVTVDRHLRDLDEIDVLTG